jgi:hypothetical protein
MKSATLYAAAAVVLAANAFALAHVYRNRSAQPDAEIVLTARELSYYARSSSDEDSEVALYLVWNDTVNLPWPSQESDYRPWLDLEGLRRLGFDCSVDPASPAADTFYTRQRPRQAYVALEFDGPAFLEWRDRYNRARSHAIEEKLLAGGGQNDIEPSHLVPVDADLDAAALRARHPDRSSVIILPAVIGVTRQYLLFRRQDPAARPQARLHGFIREIPSTIHVPRPFSDLFRSGKTPPYRVRLRYGASFEPWVAGVDFP